MSQGKSPNSLQQRLFYGCAVYHRFANFWRSLRIVAILESYHTWSVVDPRRRNPLRANAVALERNLIGNYISLVNTLEVWYINHFAIKHNTLGFIARREFMRATVHTALTKIPRLCWMRHNTQSIDQIQIIVFDFVGYSWGNLGGQFWNCELGAQLSKQLCRHFYLF